MPANDTGGDIEIGLTNSGQDGTELIGAASPHGNFGNDYVLRVDSQTIITNRNDVDGIRGFAHGQGRGVLGHADGNAGVWGEGPTGVHGQGKTGIHGEGDNVGVQGNSDGTAVLGMSTGGVGVSGASTSGVGVVGSSRGTGGIGVQGTADDSRGIGVQGISGQGFAVFATSGRGTGLEASSNTGIAVNAHSQSERGGVFKSDRAAQIRLIPHEPSEPIPEQTLPSVVALIAKGHEESLPVHGQTGDLLCISMKGKPLPGAPPPKSIGVLWFCAIGGDENDAAQWRQVLLGSLVTGKG